MTKEYGRRNLSRQKTGSKSLLIMLVGFLFGYLGASVFDLTSLHNWINARFQEETMLKPKEVAAEEPLPQPKFEFYTLLTHDQKTIANPASSTAESAIKTEMNKSQINVQTQGQIKKSTSKETFFLQVGSFRSQQEAERIRASLTLKGFVINVNQVNQQNTIWYRVMIGPFPSKEEAQQAQISVSRSEHINGMIRELESG